MRISDELRNWRDIYCGTFVDEDDCKKLRALADRIDSELMALPRDRNGVPIHVGDTVYLDDGREAKVTRIGIGMDKYSIYTVVYGEDFSLTPGYVTHTSPDSFERIADELLAWCDYADVDGNACDKPRELAVRIRKLAKEDK